MEDMQTTTTSPQVASGDRKERLMASTSISTSTFESEVRDFAAEFPTANVQRAVALCENGTLTWVEVAEIFRHSLAHGLRVVRA